LDHLRHFEGKPLDGSRKNRYLEFMQDTKTQRHKDTKIWSFKSEIRNPLAGVVLLSLFLLLPHVTRAQETYIWPLDAARGISSSFGEYRPGHLHAGADMKTWGEVGVKVRAISDGYVSRIHTSPGGYGKAVYIKLRTGETAVYAHLSDFAPELRREVERVQEARRRYSIDLFLEPDRFPVGAGEVIGRSGRSGTRAPHLHFELRDPGEHPVNPLCNGIGVEDTRAPRMETLALIPLGARASVEGGPEALVLPLVREKRTRTYTTARRPLVSGAIGLAVSVYDQADGAHNRLAPYRLRLFVDGHEVFECRYDRFSYGNTRKVELDRNFGLRQKGHGTFHNLFVAEGNDLPFYRGRGILDNLVPGAHQIVVEAADVHGNLSSAAVEVLVDARPRIWTFEARREVDRSLLTVRAVDPDDPRIALRIDRSEDQGETWEEITRDSLRAGEETRTFWAPIDPDRPTIFRATATDRWGVQSLPRTSALPPRTFDLSEHPTPILSCVGTFGPNALRLAVKSSELLVGPPVVYFARAGDPPARTPIEQTGLASYLAMLELLPGRDGPIGLEVEATTPYGRVGRCTFEFVQQGVTRSEGGQVETLDGKAQAIFLPGGVYETLFPRILSSDPHPVETLPSVGRAYAFEPSDVPFDRNATVSLRYPEDVPNPEKLAVYTAEDESTYTFAGNVLDLESRTVSAQVQHFSSYVLRIDETPPVISDLYPGEGAQIRRRRPVLSAHVEDLGSGIGGEEEVIVCLDGRQVISEWDPPVKAVRYFVRHPLTSGPHHLEVVVRDRCGNEARASSRFVVE